MWRRVDPVKRTDVSEERIASLLQPAQAGFSPADFSAKKMEAIRSSETSVLFTGSTRPHIPEDGIFNSKNIADKYRKNNNNTFIPHINFVLEQ
jgi:hypothetical protein